MKQTISLIVAFGKGRVIGNKGKIPWHSSADFAYFKRTTEDHPVIMGAVTHRSIGKLLSGRKNIVVCSECDFEALPGTILVSTLDAAFAAAEEGEVFVIGGARIYASTIDRAHKLYVTEVDGEFEGDTFFPEIKKEEWKEVSREKMEPGEKEKYALEWVVYERKEK